MSTLIIYYYSIYNRDRKLFINIDFNNKIKIKNQKILFKLLNNLADKIFAKRLYVIT